MNVRKIIANKESPNENDNFFNARFSPHKCDTLIPKALAMGKADVAIFLVDEGLQIDYSFVDNHGRTPVHCMVELSAKHTRIFDILKAELAKGIPANIINKQDLYMNTAVHMAMVIRNFAAIELLESYGANKKIANANGDAVFTEDISNQGNEDNVSDEDKLNETINSLVKMFVTFGNPSPNSPNSTESLPQMNTNFSVSMNESDTQPNTQPNKKPVTISSDLDLNKMLGKFHDQGYARILNKSNSNQNSETQLPNILKEMVGTYPVTESDVILIRRKSLSDEMTSEMLNGNHQVGGGSPPVSSDSVKLDVKTLSRLSEKLKKDIGVMKGQVTKKIGKLLGDANSEQIAKYDKILTQKLKDAHFDMNDVDMCNAKLALLQAKLDKYESKQ